MQPTRDRVTGNLILRIQRNESEYVALVMQLLMEEWQERGEDTPRLGRNFFDRLTRAQGESHIEFGFKYLEFVSIFLEEIANTSEDMRDTDVIWIKWFLDAHQHLRAKGVTIH